MNTRWLLTILANCGLSWLLLRWRPCRMNFVYLSQAFVMVSTVVMVAMYYQAPDALYNSFWCVKDVLQMVFELIVAAELLRDHWRQNEALSLVPVVITAAHFRVWLEEYWNWEPIATANALGLQVLNIRQWLNLALIGSLALVVYYRGSASSAQRKHA